MEFFSQLANGDVFAILVLVWVVLRVILGIVEAIGTRNISSVKKTIKELEQMLIIYRLPNYQDVDDFDKSVNKQKFSEETPDYAYNEHTGELEATGQFTNDKEKIQSYRSSSFEELLKKYLDVDTAIAVSEKPVEPKYGDMPSYDDMADFAKLIEKSENYRERYGLPLELTPIEIFEQVGKIADFAKKAHDVPQYSEQDLIQYLKSKQNEEVDNEKKKTE